MEITTDIASDPSLINQKLERNTKHKSKSIRKNAQITKREDVIHKKEELIDNIVKFIAINENPKIKMLRNREVIQWIFNDLSFLPPVDAQIKTPIATQLKNLEDIWGRSILKQIRPDLKLDKQWTNKFGEYICFEIFILSGKKINVPIKKHHYLPDAEIEEAIIEVKTGTYNTKGTAFEKILGCPFKYAEIPDLYGKELQILCIGGAEKFCKEQYGNFPGAKCCAQKKKFLDFFRENRIEYIAATDLILSIIAN